MTLVSCDHCGVVYEKEKAGGFVRCPTCESTTRKVTPVPGLGRVNKWWSEVQA